MCALTPMTFAENNTQISGVDELLDKICFNSNVSTNNK